MHVISVPFVIYMTCDHEMVWNSGVSAVSLQASFREKYFMRADGSGADFESVYQRIKNLIVVRGVRPNQHLALRPVATLFDTSTTSVREALIQLKAEGLISHHSRRGFYVHALESGEMTDRYDLFFAILKHCIETGIDNFSRGGTNDTLHIYRSRLDYAAAHAVPYRVETHVEAIENLYRHLVELSGNRIILGIIDNFCEATHYVRHLHLSDPERLRHTEHRLSEMINSLTSGQTADAVETLGGLVETTIERLPDLVIEGNAKSLMMPPLYEE